MLGMSKLAPTQQISVSYEQLLGVISMWKCRLIAQTVTGAETGRWVGPPRSSIFAKHTKTKLHHHAAIGADNSQW